MVGRIYYPVTTLGYGKRIGIWLVGCDKRCENCISPEFQTENGGAYFSVDEIVNMINERKDIIDGVTISGGEPLKQAEELRSLIEKLLLLEVEDILIYSGYTKQQIQLLNNPNLKYILDNAACVILGEYVESQNDGLGIRGSKNQEIIVNKFKERYVNAGNCMRKQQIILSEKGAMIIGIPPRGRE